MSWLSPAMLGWLGLLGPLLVLYVLRPRRVERKVGSTLLWEAVARERSAERPFQRLVARASLLLQAAVLVLGALALARPAYRTSGGYGGRVAIVVDVSASMQAEDRGSRPRLESARAMARSVVDSLGPTADAFVIEASRTPRLVLPPSADRVALRRAIDGLRPRSPDADLGAAIRLARDRLRGEGRIVVFSDLAFDGSVDAGAGRAEIAVRRVGRPVDNWAVLGADAVVEAEDPSGSDVVVFARVASRAQASRALSLRVLGEDERLLAARSVSLAAGQTSTATLGVRLPATMLDRVLRVRLVDANGSDLHDGLALDDERVLRAPGLGVVSVVLAGSAPEPVVRALRSDRRVGVFATELEDLARVLARPALADALVVAVGRVPEAAHGHDVLLLDATDTRPLGVTLGPRGPSSRIVRVADDDEMMRFVAPEEWAVTEAAPLGGDVLRPLLVTEIGPLVGRVEHHGGAVVVLGFDPARSLWPRHPSFVVFVHDVVAAASRRASLRRIPDGCLGEPLEVATGSDGAASIREPGHAALRSIGELAPGTTIETTTAGLFRLTDRGGERLFVRSLCVAAESDLTARGRIEARSREPHDAPTRASTLPNRTDVGPYVALVAMLLLLVESLHATRGTRA